MNTDEQAPFAIRVLVAPANCRKASVAEKVTVFLSVFIGVHPWLQMF
jgi:hypothetical protein